MAVYTAISHEELNEFLAPYDVGLPQSLNGIAEGVENSNYRLRTDRANYILTIYEKRMRADDLPFFLSLMAGLAERGVHCPLPLRRRDGTLWGYFKGKPAALLTFLQGRSRDRPQVQHCTAAAAACAQLHIAGSDLTLTRQNELGLEGWHRLASAVLEKADTVERGLGALIAQSLSHLDHVWPQDLPNGIIHADLFPDNVLFADDRVSGLIDFYFACNDAFAYDLAIMLNAWCFESDGSYNTTKGSAMIAAYRRERDLSQVEIDALPVLAHGAALRFLLTRLYDWLHPDKTAIVRPKNPREFSKRLRFHARASRAGDYIL